MIMSELRVGDYFNYQQGTTKKQGFICCINYKTVTIGDFVERFTIKLKSIEAIPLTEEWLLKFGFVRQGKRNMWVKGKICVVFESYTNLRNQSTLPAFYIGFKDLGNVIFHTTFKVEYVHILQNAFALSNEELTFKSE